MSQRSSSISSEHNAVEIDDLSVSYREAGPTEAATVVLLHGFPSSSHMYRDLIPELARDYHVVAPDYPGFGHSDAPRVDEFEYTFDHLADIVAEFLRELDLTPATFFIQDYGAPVGFRIAVEHPEWIDAFVVQNANAYEEGVTDTFRDLLGPVWEHRTGATEAPVLDLFELEGTKWLYQTGTRDPDGMNPDAWKHDQYGLNRPQSDLIQLDLQADYQTNLDRYPEWHEYFREHQPPTLVVWGENDPIFGPDGARAYEQDLDTVEVHLFDTGHFALEEDCDEIAQLTREFLTTHLPESQ